MEFREIFFFLRKNIIIRENIRKNITMKNTGRKEHVWKNMIRENIIREQYQRTC